MEWDQITDKWSQMARRLRSDRPGSAPLQGQRRTGAALDRPRGPTAPGAQLPTTLSSDRAGDEHGLTSHL